MSEQSTLDVGAYDPHTDTIVIEGTRYAGVLFRELGFKAMVGREFRVLKHENETITLERYPNTGRPIIELLEHAIKEADGWHDDGRGGPIKDDYILDMGRKQVSESKANVHHLGERYGN